MQKQITKKEALQKAQAICAKKECCKFEIKKKLFQWQLNPEFHTWILKSLENERFIDESRYVEFYVRDKFRINKWGKIKIAYELKSKGVSTVLINENLDKINETEYQDTCKTIMLSKVKSLNNEQDKSKLKEKIIRFAHSKGFETDLIFKIYETSISGY